jgi:NADP-dependent 3-hydroxy acid dehydrogenase YdfG
LFCRDYPCTKYGLRGFGYGIFEDLRERGVSVTNIYPSLTNTELGSQFRREFSDLCGLSQDEMLKPSDIAQSVSFAVTEIAIETQHNLYKIFQEYDKAIVEEKQ